MCIIYHNSTKFLKNGDGYGKKGMYRRHKHHSYCLISPYSQKIESSWQVLKSSETEIVCTGTCVIHILWISRINKIPERAQETPCEDTSLMNMIKAWRMNATSSTLRQKIFHLLLWQLNVTVCHLPDLLGFFQPITEMFAIIQLYIMIYSSRHHRPPPLQSLTCCKDEESNWSFCCCSKSWRDMIEEVIGT